jgi:hypothetical protein
LSSPEASLWASLVMKRILKQVPCRTKQMSA